MLSKMESKQMKEESSFGSFPEANRKVVNRNNQYPIRLTHETLGLQQKKEDRCVNLEVRRL